MFILHEISGNLTCTCAINLSKIGRPLSAGGSIVDYVMNFKAGKWCRNLCPDDLAWVLNSIGLKEYLIDWLWLFKMTNENTVWSYVHVKRSATTTNVTAISKRFRYILYGCVPVAIVDIDRLGRCEQLVWDTNICKQLSIFVFEVENDVRS